MPFKRTKDKIKTGAKEDDYRNMDVDWFDRDEVMGDLYGETMDFYYYFENGNGAFEDQQVLNDDIYKGVDAAGTGTVYYKLIDDLAACLYVTTSQAASTCDPTDNTDVAATGFDLVWEAITLPTDASTYMLQPYNKNAEFYGMGETASGCYGYTATVDPTYYGSMTFA